MLNFSFFSFAQARIMSAWAFLHLSRASQREVSRGSGTNYHFQTNCRPRPRAPTSVVQGLKPICKRAVANNFAHKVLLKTKCTTFEGWPIDLGAWHMYDVPPLRYSENEDDLTSVLDSLTVYFCIVLDQKIGLRLTIVWTSQETSGKEIFYK